MPLRRQRMEWNAVRSPGRARRRDAAASRSAGACNHSWQPCLAACLADVNCVMNLSPREKDKLLIAVAAMVARRRLERGIKLYYPEAIALISDFVVEGARDGKSVAQLMEAGAHVVSAAQVM